MCNITKIFPGIIANDNITLQLKKGEIHALLGENGAGKSTLMNVLFGLYTPEKGEIKKNGKIIKINGPNDANKLAIGMVHQHFMLVDNFTVLQNIVLGDEPIHKGFLSLDKARKKVIELSEKYKLEVDPDALVRDITVGMQQRVEILKMLYRDNEILIFDEPTAVLTPQEIEELLKIMKNLANEGKSILFITHKLDEIKKVADSCTVLRKGKYIGTVEVSDVSKEELSEMMVGHEVKLKVDKEVSNPGEVILSVENISMEDKFGGKEKLKNISFKIRAGEIVCIAGIDGNGQSELVYALSGLEKVKSGEIKLNNKDITNLSVRNRFLEGMAHIPEDRHKFGLVLDYNLAYNLVLHSYFEDAYQKFGFLNYDEIYKHADEMINKFDIRSSQGSHTIVRTMSGGNQQKAVIAREIISNPDLLIAVQPTRGLDVGAIEQVHRQLVEERDKGKAILLVSLELDEVMNVSDRILVMYEGELVADVEPKSVTYQELGLFMSGAKRGENYG
ncbi:ABC transporter ATP-binding protein [Miniphocaeibacter sp.]|uniref:ABC transporter ATP-binding protein n=1 Tax=Miniphocaeibacter sp. TaxID=3100973 RepID=UPI003BB21097